MIFWSAILSAAILGAFAVPFNSFLHQVDFPVVGDIKENQTASPELAPGGAHQVPEGSEPAPPVAADASVETRIRLLRQILNEAETPKPHCRCPSGSGDCSGEVCKALDLTSTAAAVTTTASPETVATTMTTSAADIVAASSPPTTAPPVEDDDRSHVQKIPPRLTQTAEQQLATHSASATSPIQNEPSESAGIKKMKRSTSGTQDEINMKENEIEEGSTTIVTLAADVPKDFSVDPEQLERSRRLYLRSLPDLADTIQNKTDGSNNSGSGDSQVVAATSTDTPELPKDILSDPKNEEAELGRTRYVRLEATNTSSAGPASNASDGTSDGQVVARSGNNRAGSQDLNLEDNDESEEIGESEEDQSNEIVHRRRPKVDAKRLPRGLRTFKRYKRISVQKEADEREASTEDGAGAKKTITRQDLPETNRTGAAAHDLVERSGTGAAAHDLSEGDETRGDLPAANITGAVAQDLTAANRAQDAAHGLPAANETSAAAHDLPAASGAQTAAHGLTGVVGIAAHDLTAPTGTAPHDSSVANKTEGVAHDLPAVNVTAAHDLPAVNVTAAHDLPAVNGTATHDLPLANITQAHAHEQKQTVAETSANVQARLGTNSGAATSANSSAANVTHVANNTGPAESLSAGKVNLAAVANVTQAAAESIEDQDVVIEDHYGREIHHKTFFHPVPESRRGNSLPRGERKQEVKEMAAKEQKERRLGGQQDEEVTREDFGNLDVRTMGGNQIDIDPVNANDDLDDPNRDPANFKEVEPPQVSSARWRLVANWLLSAALLGAIF